MEIVDDRPPPVVCTLGVKPRAAQQLEWQDLAAVALTADAVENGAVFTFPLDTATAIEELADRERSCCGTWLDIATDRVDGALRVAMTTANRDGVAMIREIAGMPTTRRRRAAESNRRRVPLRPDQLANDPP